MWTIILAYLISAVVSCVLTTLMMIATSIEIQDGDNGQSRDSKSASVEGLEESSEREAKN